jgi:hypothetical protein
MELLGRWTKGPKVKGLAQLSLIGAGGGGWFVSRYESFGSAGITQSNKLTTVKGPLSYFNSFFYKGISQLGKSAACPKFDLVWIYRLPIPLGRRGVICSFKLFLPAFATLRGRGRGVGTLWGRTATLSGTTQLPAVVYHSICTQTTAISSMHHATKGLLLSMVPLRSLWRRGYEEIPPLPQPAGTAGIPVMEGWWTRQENPPITPRFGDC